MIPLQDSEFRLNQWNPPRGSRLASGHMIIILGDFSHTLLPRMHVSTVTAVHEERNIGF